MTTTTITHAAPEIFRAQQSISRKTKGAGHRIDITTEGVVTDLHKRVDIAHFHTDESVVGDLDQLGILDSRFVEGLVVDRCIELFGLLGGSFISNTEKYKLRIQEVLNRCAHGDEKWVVAEFDVVVEYRQNLSTYCTRQHRRDDHYDLVLTILSNRSR